MSNFKGVGKKSNFKTTHQYIFSSFKIRFIFILIQSILPGCVRTACIPGAPSRRQEEDVRSPTGVTGSCEVLGTIFCRCSQCSCSLSLFPTPARTFSTALMCYFFKRLSPPLTKAFPAQLWLNKLLLFFIYFYLKEFVSLSQKISHTANSKVHSYTDGEEFSG